MARFVGRTRELAMLQRLLDRVATSEPARPGKALLIRGRRRVGKSRLVEEFIARAGVPVLFFTASTRTSAEELRLFADEAQRSALPGAALFAGTSLTTWEGALRLLVAAVPDDRPSIVVLDELPYLTASDPAFEGTLQKLFDRELSRKPVLLIGIGSDLAMMEALNAYGRPFHQRATELVVPPLSPAEVGTMLDLPAAEAFDAFLVTGGLPLICDEWPRGMSRTAYLADATAYPTSALLVSAERALAAEFPTHAQALTVLTVIGSGERTFKAIAQHAGIPEASLTRSLATLVDKRMVAAFRPLSVRPSRETRYHITDPYLRFWLAFLGPHLTEIERGRGDLIARRIAAGWTSWRGRAIEPIIRESLERLPDDSQPGSATVFGGYWTRTNHPEVDLIGADKAPVAGRIHVVGSIKWLEDAPFDRHDLAALAGQREEVPGANSGTPLLAVSRSGCTADIPHLGPEQLLAAWPT